jgi:hypothetical protein
VQLQGRHRAVAQLGTVLAPRQSYVFQTTSESPIVVQEVTKPARAVARVDDDAQPQDDDLHRGCSLCDAIERRNPEVAKRYEAVLLNEQSVAVAGSMTLPVVHRPDGSCATRAQRPADEEWAQAYSLVATHNKMPALAPAQGGTLDISDERPRGGLAGVPMSVGG